MARICTMSYLELKQTAKINLKFNQQHLKIEIERNPIIIAFINYYLSQVST